MMRLLQRLTTIPRRLRSIVLRHRVEQDLDDEIRDHLERHIEAGLGRGLTREQARAAALQAFGGVEQRKEECRDMRRINALEHTVQDLRFAVRLLARTPAAAATMIVVFALGIGTNSALFMLLQSLLNGPVPGVGRVESLVRIRGIDRSMPGRQVGREFSYPEYREYVDQRTLFRDVAAWTSSDIVFDSGPPGAENLHSGAATYVTARYFDVLGVRPTLGAGLPADAPDVAGDPPLVAVISQVVWERHYQRSPDVIGTPMKVNGVPVTIVGVAPHRFAGARTGGSQMRVWLPLSARPLVQHTTSMLVSYDDARFGLVARLQPGITPEQAGPTVRAIGARAAEQTTRPNAALSADVVALLATNYFPPSGGESDVGMGAVIAPLFPLLILLITCTTVSALLAGLAVARRREIAVRLALGASRRRVVRQLVTESVLLALTAGALGLCVIWVLLRLFDASIPDLEVTIDWRAIAFTFGIAVVAGVLFGVSPALHGTRVALAEALKDAPGSIVARRLGLQSGLVVAQIALTVPALLAMGALLLEMQADLRKLPSQPFADRIVDVRFNSNPRYETPGVGRESTLARLHERFAGLSGVSSVVAQESADEYFDIAPHPADLAAGVEVAMPRSARAVAAPAGYFELMGIAIVRGRDFEAAERAGDDAIVIGSDLARRVWGEGNPIGRRLVSTERNQRAGGALTVVGVVAADRPDQRSVDGDARIFVPRVRATGGFLVRTQGPGDTLLPAIRAAAADAAPGVPVISARTLASIEMAGRRSVLNVITAAGSAGGLALALSAIGLYAVVSFAVTQRTREIGIHTALGADRRQIVAMFASRGLRLCLVGLAIGGALSLAGLKVMSATGVMVLSGPGGQLPPSGTLAVWAVVLLLVVAVAMLASWIPARQAARVDPLEALRME